MKKSLILLMAFTAALTFSGCRKKSNIEPTTVPDIITEAATEESSTEVQETETKETETEAQIEEYLDRASTKEIVCFIKDKEEKLSASLYTGEAYSIYIMDEGWDYSKETVDGFSADVWKSTTKSKALLKVIALKDKNMMEAQEYIKTAYPEYGLTEDKQGGLGGMNKSEDMMEARFYNSDNQIYAVVLSYPSSETKNHGVMLYAMADTFKS